MNLRKLIKELRHKLRRDQDNLALRLELADLYRDDGNIAEALQIYREVAVTYTRVGRLDEAKTACRRALDLAPRDADLEALMNEIRRAQHEARAAAGRDVPQRRAQVWQTPSVASPEPGSPDGGGAVPAEPSAPAAGADAPAGRMTSPSVIYAGSHAEQHGTQFTLTPTPLPAPLALHDAVEDSLMAQQPMRFRASLSGPVPQVSLPTDLTGGEDDVLALAASASGAVPHPSAPEHLPASAPEPAGNEDPDDEEEDTDVRDRMARLVPIDDDRVSQDLTRPVLRLSTEPPPPARHVMDDDRPVFASGEISIDSRNHGHRRAAAVSDVGRDRDHDAHAGIDEADDGDQTEDREDSRDGRDTHPSLGDGSVHEEAGDELTWIKELPDPPEPPTPSVSTNPMHAVPRALPEVISEGMPRPVFDSPSGVVHTPLSAADLLDETHPVSIMEPGMMHASAHDDDDVPGTVMDAEAVDEDKILAEVPVQDRARPRRRSAPRTIMDMAPPVPLAAASVAARKTALSTVFPSFPGHVLEDLAEHVALRSFSDSEYVFREGEPGHACFVIASGTVRVMRRDPVVEGQGMVEITRLSRGALFGERAFLPDRCRHGAAQAVGSCTLYEIPRRTLRELVAVHQALGPLLEVFYREHLVAMLSETMPFLRTLPRTWRESVRSRFRPVRRASGETILRQGERMGGLYMVVLGSVEITQRPSVRRARLLATLGEGTYFGDMSRLDLEGVVGATVSAAGPVELAMLPAEEYDAIVRERPMLWTEICERGHRRELERSNLITGETPML
jgi:CRP-like cAMP-binding protein